MKTNKLVSKVLEVLDKFCEKYKFPRRIFIEVFDVQETADKIKAYIKIDPAFHFEPPVLTPADFVLLLQKFVPAPYGKLENKDLYLYFVLADIEKKEALEQPDPYFQAELLDEALNRVQEPVLDSKQVDAVLAYWMAKGITKKLKDALFGTTKWLESTEEDIWVPVGE